MSEMQMYIKVKEKKKIKSSIEKLGKSVSNRNVLIPFMWPLLHFHKDVFQTPLRQRHQFPANRFLLAVEKVLVGPLVCGLLEHFGAEEKGHQRRGNRLFLQAEKLKNGKVEKYHA